jgi:hypothetical protein
MKENSLSSSTNAEHIFDSKIWSKSDKKESFEVRMRLGSIVTQTREF